MAIVVESVSAVASAAATTNLTITKPTGVAVGDLLVSVLYGVDANASINSGTWSLLSGWTNAITNNLDFTGGASGVSCSIQYKLAGSSDVSASNYTFSHTNAETLRGYIVRASGANQSNPLGATDSELNTTANSSTFTGNISAYTPPENGALVIMQVASRDSSDFSASFSGYTVPNTSFTEAFELSVGDGSPIISHGSAYGVQTTAAEITTYTATISRVHERHAGQLAIFLPPVNATGTNTLATATSTTFTQAGTCDTIGSNNLATATSQAFTQGGKGTTPTQWTNEPATTTTWTNET